MQTSRFAAGLLLAAVLPLVSASAQQITRHSAPAIGKQMVLEYGSTAGNTYALLVSNPPFGATPVPGVSGTLFLNLAGVTHVVTKTVPPIGTDTLTFRVPNNAGMLGLCVGFQTVDLTPPATLAFSTNFAEVCVSRGIGTVTLSQASSTSTTVGDSDVQTVVNLTAGVPVSQGLPALSYQTITWYGSEGWTPLTTPTFTSTEMADLDIERPDRNARDMREPSRQRIHLANGFDLYICRDMANPKQFFLLSVDRATGVAKELTGSRVTDVGTSATPASNYLTTCGITPDGEVALMVQGDSTNNPVNNVGPADRIVLVKTDPTKTWSNGLNVLDVSPAAGPDKMHTAYNGMRIVNGVGFVEGEEPSGTTGAAALWAGPVDGSAPFTRVTVPNTGTGKAFYWASSMWRVSGDQKTMLFHVSGNTTSSAQDADYMAIANIASSSLPLTCVNITGFTTSTQLQTPGNAGIGLNNLRASLTPDGKFAAVVIGSNTSSNPGGIAVVPTDGSKAGMVTPFTAAQFDPQVVTWGEVHWLDNNRLLFGGGTTTSAFDLYVHDRTTGTTTNVTKTTTGSIVPPFTQGGTSGNVAVRGSWFSDNRQWYYFARGYTSTTLGLSSDIKALNTATSVITDITGSEFSAGTSPSIWPISTAIYAWQPRRSPTGNLTYFVAGKNTGTSSMRADDEVWAFDQEAGTPTFQVTANNGTGSSTSAIRQIQDLRLSPDGARVAFAMATGTSTTVPEHLYVVPGMGGPAVQVTRSPTSGGMGIRRGTVHFTPAPVAGICWVQGTGSRTVPSANAAAYWNDFTGTSAPLLLTAPPVASPAKHLFVLNTSPLNP